MLQPKRKRWRVCATFTGRPDDQNITVEPPERRVSGGSQPRRPPIVLVLTHHDQIATVLRRVARDLGGGLTHQHSLLGLAVPRIGTEPGQMRRARLVLFLDQCSDGIPIFVERAHFDDTHGRQPANLSDQARGPSEQLLRLDGAKIYADQGVSIYHVHLTSCVRSMSVPIRSRGLPAGAGPADAIGHIVDYTVDGYPAVLRRRMISQRRIQQRQLFPSPISVCGYPL